MKIMFSAGEASGDTHAAGVARALRELYPDVEMLGMGGTLMADAGVRIVYDIKNLGFIGLAEIVKALPFFFKLRNKLGKIMDEEKPDVFVCVDYPGFNMRLAKLAHEKGIPVLYYICPTIWAWHKSRGKDIAKYTDRVACIFPFEAKAYEEFMENVSFVGHPLVDLAQAKRSKEESLVRFGAKQESTKILLMPGSRKQEIETLLEFMLQGLSLAIKGRENIEVFLPRAHTISREELTSRLEKYDIPVTITEGDNYDLMQICDIAIAASGTATLETAIMGVPTILLYRVSPVTYAIVKRLIKLNHVGLPNIVAGKEVIPELLQNEVSPENIAHLVKKLLDEIHYREQMKEDLAAVKLALGEPGAVKRVAGLIANLAGQEDLHE